MKNLTWLNAIEYIETHDNYAAQIIATMRQNFTKLHGFRPKGNRATAQDKEDWRVWLASQPLPLMTRESWLDSREQVLAASEMTSAQKRNKRFFFSRFVDNLDVMGYLLTPPDPDPEPVKEKKNWKGRKARSRRKPEWAGQPVDEDSDRADKRLLNEEIILNLTAAFYLPFYRERYPERTDEELLAMIQKELSRIEADLKKFEHYLGIRPKGRQRGPTQNINVRAIRRLFGWLFKQTGDLASISFTKLIPVINIRIGIHEFGDPTEYFIQKGKLDAEIEAAAEYVVDFLLDYFDNYNPNYGKRSKLIYINALINLAKYLYQKINQKTKYSKFQDIPIIGALRRLRSDLPNDPPRAKKIPLTLDVLIGYLEQFKVDLDYPYNESIINGHLIKTERKLTSIAHDMQRFLMLCLLVLVHPLRRRSLAELQWGKTLVKGMKTTEGNFIRQEKMADPSQALYYYDMLPEEYKTGDTYGPYCVALPNHRFQDGTCFYDYLEKYLFGGYRQALLRHGQDHQYLFVRINDIKKWGSRAGDPISWDSYSDVIYDFSKKITGVGISPKKFRTIYRTYYVNLGAPPSVLDGLAYCMQHSPETAAKDYTWQTLSEKLAPFVQFFEEHFC